MVSLGQLSAKKAEYRAKLQEKLQPHEKIILDLESILAFERPPQLGALVLVFWVVVGLVATLVNNLTFLSLGSLAIAAYYAGWLISEKVSLPPVVLGQPTRKAKHHLSLKEIIGYIIGTRFYFHEIASDVNTIRESNPQPVTVKIILFSLVGAFLGSLFSGTFLVLFFGTILLLLPGVLANDFLDVAAEKAPPAVKKYVPLVKEKLQQFVSKFYSGAEELKKTE
eukprot:TRINITY_DN969_c0_g4_i1.p1 TRINITY_DN969_c0_g4~~TRINITY_DN969_c0_g4_i1.p1  ORF type:complete len:224 (+),score=73.54 TRINITY_DN969_c0_g4_i1:91-762(+)